MWLTPALFSLPLWSGFRHDSRHKNSRKENSMFMNLWVWCPKCGRKLPWGSYCDCQKKPR